MERRTSDGGFPFSEAKWLWSPEHGADEMNAVFSFAQTFHLEAGQLSKARIALTADARYRLFVNDAWVEDGPGRGFPESYFFDDLEIASFLREGKNRLRVQVTHWGVDTFQSLRAQPGLVAAVYSPGEPRPWAISDATWKCRREPGHGWNVPRVSCQLGFEEQIDASVPSGPWGPVTVSATQPGHFLTRQPVPPLGKVNRTFRRIAQIDRVESIAVKWTFHVREHLSPFPRGANVHGMAGVFGTLLRCRQRTAFRLYVLGQIQFLLALYLDGKARPLMCDQDLGFVDVEMEPGTHWLSLPICQGYDHLMEIGVGCDAGPSEVEWANPLEEAATPWVTTGPLWKDQLDSQCYIRNDGTSWTPETFDRSVLEKRVGELALCPTFIRFSEAVPGVETVSERHVTKDDVYFTVRTDRPQEERGPMLENPQGLITDSPPAPVVVTTSGTRVILDLGEMTIGYFFLYFQSEGSAIVDGYFFEHLQEEPHGKIEKIQYTQNSGSTYRTSFRYVAASGPNEFLSTQRRGGRYVLLVFRNLASPLRIDRVGIVESTYPARQQAAFSCSDERLNRIFSVSQRTALLCMEDTFTDCPTYEQAFWVGDARTQALVAGDTFGADDLIEHGWRLVAQSLDQLPLAACQCPSGWDALIPSFSFLWGIAVREHYWRTGNRSFLRDIYPAVRKNLETACRFRGDHGLFSAPTWNFLDWTSIDQGGPTVLHNSMLLAAALEAGEKIAREIGAPDDASTWQRERGELKAAIHRLWDGQAYRDALLPDGKLSPSRCQHTSFLALLYDLVPSECRAAALANCLHLPAGMTGVGSPNALCFLLEALRKEGRSDAALEVIRNGWGPMLDAGATTFWEMIGQRGKEFPTRSHCHGWSSSPAYFLPRLFFGLECVEAGWRKVVLRPQSFGLAHARAEICTPLGLLKMAWTRNPDGSFDTHFEAPDTMEVAVEPLFEHENTLLSHSR